MRPFSGKTGVGKLAWQFGRSVFAELGHLESGSEADLADTLSHLVRLTLLEFSGSGAVASFSCRAILVDRIKSYIQSNLRSPDLSVERMALALNCTARYLHKAFEAEEESISDYIWRLRLERCREELLNPDCHNKSITDIAFSWGFNNSAHFSTAFKERFGVAPRSYRKEEQSDSAQSLFPITKVPSSR
jgi:AraC-like DNA-binding protein